MNIQKGDIVMVDLPNTGGSVQSGTRPCIIVQNNIGNKYSPITIVVPLTSKKTKRNMPTHVDIPRELGVVQDSVALCEQTIIIDKSRLLKMLGSLNETYLHKVQSAILKTFEMDFKGTSNMRINRIKQNNVLVEVI